MLFVVCPPGATSFRIVPRERPDVGLHYFGLSAPLPLSEKYILLFYKLTIHHSSITILYLHNIGACGEMAHVHLIG